MKSNILKILIIGILWATQSCALEFKRPKFQTDSKEVINQLKELKEFENATIKWSTNSFNDNDTTTNILIVQLENGRDMIEDDAELRNLGREAMKIVNNSIENESDYDRFHVVFVQKSSIGPLSKSFSKPYVYSFDELR